MFKSSFGQVSYSFVTCSFFLVAVATGNGCRPRNFNAELNASKNSSKSDSASEILDEVKYQFDSAKIQAAPNAFHFLRSFVDYYYLLINSNQKKLPTLASFMKVGGWCVGDGHPENFGALVQEDSSSLFTMNDMDDGGPCPLLLDLSRLMVSSVLYDADIDVADIMKAYQDGIKGESVKPPSAIKSMLKNSESKGKDVAKSKVQGKRLVRNDQSEEISDNIRQEIRSALKNIIPEKSTFVDYLGTKKVGGGSGGLQRYEVLIDVEGMLRHVEMKAEVVPSIYPVATDPIPETKVRIKKLIQLTQGKGRSSYYGVVNVQNTAMLVRPRFLGNVGVDLLDKSVDKKDKLSIILYEAYQLGIIHKETAPKTWKNQVSDIKISKLKADVEALKMHFQKKYSELKPVSP